MKKYTLAISAIFACLTFNLSACGGSSIDNISTGTTEAGLCSAWPTTAGSYTKHQVSCSTVPTGCGPTLYSLLSSPQTLAAITDQTSNNSVVLQLAQLDYPSGASCTPTSHTENGCTTKDQATCVNGTTTDGMIASSVVVNATKITTTYNDSTFVGGHATCARQCVVNWTSP